MGPLARMQTLPAFCFVNILLQIVLNSVQVSHRSFYSAVWVEKLRPTFYPELVLITYGTILP